MQTQFLIAKPTGQQMSRLPTRRLPLARAEPAVINPSIDKESKKVVTTINVAELDKKGVFCRCWRSGTFPNCDGTHAKHNKETGDNVGPLIVNKSS